MMMVLTVMSRTTLEKAVRKPILILPAPPAQHQTLQHHQHQHQHQYCHQHQHHDYDDNDNKNDKNYYDGQDENNNIIAISIAHAVKQFDK